MTISTAERCIRTFLLFSALTVLPASGLAAPQTLTFDFDNFNAVTVTGTFAVFVTYGDEFLVEVTVDEEDAGAVEVSQQGSTLIIGLLPGDYNFDTLEASVTMPMLTAYSSIGTSSATLSGFDEPSLSIDLDGTGNVRGDSLQVDNLSVTVLGTGGVDFGDIDPIQAASVDLDGVIETTLNMDVGSTLTGTITGLSRLLYWGTSVDLQVVTSGLAEIVRLGDTKGAGQGDTFRINEALSDAWFNPMTNGQGFVIVVWEDISQVFLAWFTFDTERPPEDVVAILGDPGHRWTTAQGTYDGDTAVLDAYLSTGGVFDSAAPPVVTGEEPMGTITIVWSGCDEGLLTYDFTDLGLLGQIPIRRIVLSKVPACEAAQ